MKRRWEMEKGSEIRSATEELSLLVKLKLGDKQDADKIPAKPFLHLCDLVLQVLDKIGPTMAVLRGDIDKNMQRLDGAQQSDPSLNSNLVEILKKEATEGNSRKVASCSRAFVWLTRSLDFTAALLQKLVKDPELSVEKAVEDSYNSTLKQWHGWISSAAFKVALKLVPDNRTFMNALMAKDESQDTLVREIDTLISLLLTFLEYIHYILRSFRLDRLKSP